MKTPPTAILGFVLVVGACASVKQTDPAAGTGGGPAMGTGTGGLFGGLGGRQGSGGTTYIGGCKNLQCQQTTCTQGACVQTACPNGEKTTISGTTFDPAGLVPLYNVMVYVPNAPLGNISQGVSCESCDGTASGSPVASALSDSSGHFVIDNAPVGANIPLVIQVGKWRRQVMIPNVAACTDTKLTDTNMTRLPRDHTEGHLPLIALSTGHSDALDCLLRRIGIADSEFTNDSGGGRVHMYVGGDGMVGDQGSAKLASGAVFADSYQTLFANYAKLSGYDVLILQCEGEQLEASKTRAPNGANMKKYADNGGRIFAEHLHFPWFRKGPPPWPATATWIGVGTDLTNTTTPVITGTIDTSFPKGAAFADWLVAVGASTTRAQIPLMMAQHSVDAPLGFGTQRWIYTVAPTTPSVQYLTFNTPVEEPSNNQCGRVVFTDVHVGTGLGSSHPDVAFPMGCTTATALSEQQKGAGVHVVRSVVLCVAGCRSAGSTYDFLTGTGGDHDQGEVVRNPDDQRVRWSKRSPGGDRRRGNSRRWQWWRDR